MFHPNDPTWAKVKSYCESRLDGFRKALELRSTPVDETMFLRGKIEALRQLLKEHEPHE